MFWFCCGDFSSVKHSLKTEFKRDEKQMIKNNPIENDERFASIFTYNSEKNYGGNRYNNAFDWGTTKNQFSYVPSILDEHFANQNNSNIFGEFVCILLSYIFFVLTLPISLFFSLKFVNPFQRAVVMRLGKCQKKVYGQGMILLLPFIDEITIVDLRVTTIELPTIHLFTSDRGIIELFSVVLIRVLDPLIACCTVQNIKQMLNLLAYTALHRHLGKRIVSDITNPKSLAKIVVTCQAELDQFINKYGIKIDAINITKINIIKTGENEAVSVFKTLIRSDVGKQFMNVLGCPNNVKDIVIEAGKKEINKEVEVKKNDFPTSSTTSIENLNSTLSSEEQIDDPELENLLQHIRLTLFQNSNILVKRVNKCFRIKCTDCLNEFDIDLTEKSGGWCGWLWQRKELSSSILPDVHFTLSKSTIISLINGKLSPISAYINGLVSIRGSIQDAILLKNLADCCAICLNNDKMA